MAGTTFEQTFDESGTYDYFCMVHPWMTGIVTVSAEHEEMEEMGLLPVGTISGLQKPVEMIKVIM